jgi:subtilase family serine protease
MVCAMLACACATWSASALGSPDTLPSYRVQAVCGEPPTPAAAECTALRLLTGTSTEPETGEQHAAATRARTLVPPAGASAGVESTSPLSGFLTPANLHAAYDLPTETAVSSGQTVAVIDAFDDPTAEADLGVYDAQFGLPACTEANGCFRKVNESGQASPLPAEQGEWAGEISIDVQMAHAICQTCHILLVEANSNALPDLGSALDTAVKMGAGEISNSYWVPEEASIASFLEELSEEDFEHRGVAITASSGDCGYLNGACAGKPAAANFPASSPGVIAVGGTTLTHEHEKWGSTAWAQGGSGCSEVFEAPVWQSTLAGFAASGCESSRSVADVAAVANPKTGVDIYDSTPEGSTPTGWTVFGGTSVAAPIVAAEFALAGGAQGVPFPALTLYTHAGNGNDLYDVTSGSNGSCGGASSCQAGVGYDGPTGLGSPLGLGAFAPSEAPTLKSFTPTSAITGSTVTIEGKGFLAVDGVSFDGLPAQFTIVSATRIEATVPNGTNKGNVSLSTATATVASKAEFKPTLSLVSFSPLHGAPGTKVTLKGVGFSAQSSVSFAGVPAHVLSGSNKKLRVTVPAGAATGLISVTNTAAPVGTVLSAATFSP